MYVKTKVTCPYCRKTYTELPRHLRQVHKLSATQAKEARTNFSLRKVRCDRKLEKSKSNVRKLCQYPGCFATPKRMHNHLRQTHKLDISSKEYRKYLNEAIPELPGDDAPMKEVCETKETKSDSDSNESIEADFCVDSGNSGEALLRLIKKEARDMGVIEHDIYDSEADEDFLVSTSDESDSSNEGEDEEEIDCQNNVSKHTEFVLEEFLEWLQGVDGGERKLDPAMQNLRQIKAIISAVDPDNMNLVKLLNRVAVRDAWFVPYKTGKRKPGTVRAYCNSLKTFLEFIESTRIVDWPLEDLRAMQTQARHWAKSLNKSTRRREFQKTHEDLENVFDPEKVKKFENSKPCREAISILHSFSIPKVGVCPTQAQYTLTRDFLLWSLSIENGGRPGPFVDMTLDQFFNAKIKSGIKGTEISYVVPIFDHKTDYVHGPAQVVFSYALYNWFNIFVENIRGKFYGLPKDGNSPIFVAHNGNPMISKNVSGRLTSLWGKGFHGESKVKMNNTLIRKSVTTHVHKYRKDLIQPVADKLLHNVDTAKRYYNVVKKGDDAVQVSQEISKMFRTNDLSDQDITGNVSETENNQADIKWDTTNTEELAECFKSVLKSSEITMDIVKSVISQNLCLKKFEGNPKKVLDKLRYMYRKRQVRNMADLSMLPEETESEKMQRIEMHDEVFACLFEQFGLCATICHL